MFVDAVAKVVASTQPSIDYTCEKYQEAHSAIINSAAYNCALDLADGVVKRLQVCLALACCCLCKAAWLMLFLPMAFPQQCPPLQETFVYQVAASRLYPVVSPIAEPALDKLTHSPMYTAVKDHFTPPTCHELSPAPLPALCAQS